MAPKSSGVLKLQFSPDKRFQDELRKRIDNYFKSSGRKTRDNWPMYLKSAIILTCFFASYATLVFFAQSAWQVIPSTMILALSTTAIGFCIQHDGGHNSYSKFPLINKAAAMTLDLIGGSSYIWWWKHVAIHHRYTNITGYDPDIDIGVWGRLSPHQQYRKVYKWQHVYLWPLYCILAIKWQLFDDFKTLISRRIGNHTIPFPQGKDLFIFICGKVAFLSIAFVIPAIFHPFIKVLAYYTLIAATLGMLMSLIFQLPHVVLASDFPLVHNGKIEKAWAVHQVDVTHDFSKNNTVLVWALGGLNYHLEHHLFPLICHIHYPSISKIVEQTCKEFGIQYKVHASFWAGVISHFQFLRLMGEPSLSSIERE